MTTHPWFYPTLITVFAGLILMLAKRLVDRHDKMVDLVEVMDNKVSVLETRVSVLNTLLLTPYRQLEIKVAEELHHPDPAFARRDQLIERLNMEPPTITPKERKELEQLLRKVGIPSEDAQKALLLLLMPKAQQERKDNAEEMREL